MKLADLGVAAGQQLLVELRRHIAQLLRAELERQPVHAVTPGPEIIVPGLAALGKAGESALKSVAVGVDQAGEHRPLQTLHAIGKWTAGFDLLPMTVSTNGERHIALPAALDPSLLGPKETLTHAWGFHFKYSVNSVFSKGRTWAAWASSYA